MNEEVKNLLANYKKLESQFNLIDGTDNYSSLVTASSNRNVPVQRWFHFKESFSIALLEELILEWKIPSSSINRILDPFSGTGTSLLAAQRYAKKLGRTDIEAFGFERNPFLHFVANTKLHWHSFSRSRLDDQILHLSNGITKRVPERLPELSTLHRKDVFSEEDLREILGFKSAIDDIPFSERELLLLGYAIALEEISGTRKDGRMVRIVSNKQKSKTKEALTSAWSMISRDMNEASNCYQPINSSVYIGDGRTLIADVNSPQVHDIDIILYSPPYLNNIDYTEVYKIELWLCGFVNTRDQFRSLRYKTFRSHPSVRFSDPIKIRDDKSQEDAQSTLAVLIDALPRDEDFNWRSELFLGYFDDMYKSLLHQKRALREGGWIFCIVGNSLHGSDKLLLDRIPVASDIIIATIGKAIGLEVKGIEVARYLKRRGPDGHLLRESIVVMQKPVMEN